MLLQVGSYAFWVNVKSKDYWKNLTLTFYSDPEGKKLLEPRTKEA
jgi:hypothetical protein